MAQITLIEGLAWLKTLKKRHEELIALRNDNAHRERRFLGSAADREILKEPSTTSRRSTAPSRAWRARSGCSSRR